MPYVWLARTDPGWTFFCWIKLAFAMDVNSSHTLLLELGPKIHFYSTSVDQVILCHSGEDLGISNGCLADNDVLKCSWLNIFCIHGCPEYLVSRQKTKAQDKVDGPPCLQSDSTAYYKAKCRKIASQMFPPPLNTLLSTFPLSLSFKRAVTWR